MQLILKVIALGGLVDAVSMVLAPNWWERFWHRSVTRINDGPLLVRSIGAVKTAFFVYLLLWRPRQRAAV